jgi:hypothetical protein
LAVAPPASEPTRVEKLEAEQRAVHGESPLALSAVGVRRALAEPLGRPARPTTLSWSGAPWVPGSRAVGVMLMNTLIMIAFIMNMFIDRGRELAFPEKRFQSGKAELVVVYGRRRELVRRSC